MEDLRRLLGGNAAFTVSADSEMAATFVVVYDDVVAGTHEDLIADSAATLRTVPGVFEVVHEDREVLLVRASPDVGADGVAAVLHRFWDRAVTAPTPPARRRRWPWATTALAAGSLAVAGVLGAVLRIVSG